MPQSGRRRFVNYGETDLPEGKAGWRQWRMTPECRGIVNYGETDLPEGKSRRAAMADDAIGTPEIRQLR